MSLSLVFFGLRIASVVYMISNTPDMPLAIQPGAAAASSFLIEEVINTVKANIASSEGDEPD